MKRLFIILGVMGLCWPTVTSAQLTFTSNSTGVTAADLALQEAMDLWSAEFLDDITINLNVQFSNIGIGSLATSTSATQVASFVEFSSAIGTDATSADDATMFNGLPTGTTFSVYINQTSEALGSNHELPYVDDNGGLNNQSVRLTTANAKALGLRSGDDGLLDAAIIFNSSFAWDYDRSDGITNGALDFVGIALHEIGHVMGFESGVDVLDANSGGTSSDDEFDFVGSLDFLRFSEESELAGADIDWTADDRSKFFSIDGGASAAADGLSHWSTGVNHGDGEQASHWNGQLVGGIMNPTTTSGAFGMISAFDVQAFDVIGYDKSFSTVPEATGLITVLFFGPLALRRRKRS